MMMNCKQATHLMSQALDRPLRPGERLALWLHLLMCGGCANFQKQMAFLRLTCRRLGGED